MNSILATSEVSIVVVSIGYGCWFCWMCNSLPSLTGRTFPEVIVYLLLSRCSPFELLLPSFMEVPLGWQVQWPSSWVHCNFTVHIQDFWTSDCIQGIVGWLIFTSFASWFCSLDALSKLGMWDGWAAAVSEYVCRFCITNLLATRALGILIKRVPDSLLLIGSKMLYKTLLAPNRFALRMRQVLARYYSILSGHWPIS